MKLSNYVWGALLADYARGTYGSGVYGDSPGVIQIGPITLPDTGATWLTLAGILLIAIGATVFVWARQRRRITQR